EVLGDYYPYLIQVPYNQMASLGKDYIQQYFNNLSTNQLKTKNGYIIPTDFDQWTYSPGYEVKQNIADGKIDMIYIYWRVNSKINPQRVAGYSGYGFDGTPISANYVAAQCMDDYHTLFPHEFGHDLLGDNNYHNGGAGAGEGNFLSDIGGYGLLETYLGNLHFVNAWDRRRLGWQHRDATYEINALSTSLTNVNGDLIYQQNFGTSWNPSKVQEFVLRDFSTYGDALRIKLPYLCSEIAATKEQWLWVENHQMKSTATESRFPKPTGIRLNMQIGNEAFTNILSKTNYYVPLSRFGNWDFTILKDVDIVNNAPSIGAGGTQPIPIETIFASDSMLLGKLKVNKYIAKTNTNAANPFNGYHLLQTQAGDFDLDNLIQGGEFIAAETVIKDGQTLPYWYPMFGNEYDVFPVGSKLSLSTNPSLVPLITHHVDARGSRPPTDPDTNDNRTTYLNGLSVEVVEKYTDGSIRIRVRWDDFSILNDVRWCGNIVSNETIDLASSKTIKLGQGTTPTRSKNPLTFAGQKIFASPTVLTCKPKSKTILNTNSKMLIADNSALVIDSAAIFQMEAGSMLIVESGSTLKIQKGAIFPKEFNISVQQGAYLCIEAGFNQPALNHIFLSPNFIVGCNPITLSSLGNCGTISYSAPQYANAPKNAEDTTIYESVFGKFSTKYSLVGGSSSAMAPPQEWEYSKDSTIDSLVYKQFSRGGYPGYDYYVRESQDHSKVYCRGSYSSIIDEEKLVMDLNMKIGDIFSYVKYDGFKDTSFFMVDSIFLKNEKKHILLNPIKNTRLINRDEIWDTIVDTHLEFIEGIGSNMIGVFLPATRFTNYPYLLCVYKDSVLSFQNKSNFDCDHFLEIKGGSIESSSAPQFHFTLIPNPAHTQVTLKIETPIPSYQNVSIDILDIQGRPLHRQSLYTNSTILDLSKFKAGMYIFKLNVRNMPSVTKNLIIQ
ncbi:MAG: T9SS type A sorting domain-containing protein, partial [Bacteroidales bacterium]